MPTDVPAPADESPEWDPSDDVSGSVGPSTAEHRPVTVREIEALLFVAERPLSRREIGPLCGIDREQVDVLLGDLEVALRDRGIRLTSSGDYVSLTTAPETGSSSAATSGATGSRCLPPRWRRLPSWLIASR